ncbi:hypothetical protein NW766_010730 [Fusarium irregulare]|uniref:NADP-dependent oxidoreductase domain-containing protein n=1 Tax=Fusarium irregulare TaxID=2494466 RepID=A0A9W8U6F4_9HYPO|nr:hypothetical protein NW766_010730 [Fusarium irregulare]
MEKNNLPPTGRSLSSNGVFELAGFDPAEAYGVMERLLESGKVHAIGVSNFTKDRLGNLMSKVKVVPAVDQIEAHPYLQQPDLSNYCKSKAI